MRPSVLEIGAGIFDNDGALSSNPCQQSIDSVEAGSKEDDAPPAEDESAV